MAQRWSDVDEEVTEDLPNLTPSPPLTPGNLAAPTGRQIARLVVQGSEGGGGNEGVAGTAAPEARPVPHPGLEALQVFDEARRRAPPRLFPWLAEAPAPAVPICVISCPLSPAKRYVVSYELRLAVFACYFIL